MDHPPSQSRLWALTVASQSDCVLYAHVCQRSNMAAYARRASEKMSLLRVLRNVVQAERMLLFLYSPLLLQFLMMVLKPIANLTKY